MNRLSKITAQVVALMLLQLGVAYAGDGEIKLTHPSAMYPRGAEFVRVSHAGFGEAWRDPSGMVWGDVAKNASGVFRNLDQYEAIEYCQSLGAQLPAEKDFIHLCEYMGGGESCTYKYDNGHVQGFTPQILPNLTMEEDGEAAGLLAWSSTVTLSLKSAAMFFGLKGYIIIGPRHFDSEDGAEKYTVTRCVAQH